jgi:peroxiredoxin
MCQIGIIRDVMNLRRFVLLCVALSLALVIGSCRNSEPAAIGTTAPDFTENDGSRSITLSQLRGKYVLVVFWATWCPPCVQETPALVAMQQQMGSKVTVFAVSMDEDADAYKNFTAKHMPGILVSRDSDHKSSSAYGTFAYPETFLIDPNGKIVRKFIGPVEWTSPEMLEYFKKL